MSRKTCNDCQQEKALNAFGKDSKRADGKRSICKDCAVVRNRDYRRRNPERVRAAQSLSNAKYRGRNVERLSADARRYYEENAERLKARARENGKRHRDLVRQECLAAYGGKCACCGESEESFLTLDHIDGRSPEDKKTRSMTSTRMYSRAKKEGYPDSYQLLCWNCNAAKGIYGVCPHQRPRLELVS